MRLHMCCTAEDGGETTSNTACTMPHHTGRMRLPCQRTAGAVRQSSHTCRVSQSREAGVGQPAPASAHARSSSSCGARLARCLASWRIPLVELHLRLVQRGHLQGRRRPQARRASAGHERASSTVAQQQPGDCLGRTCTCTRRARVAAHAGCAWRSAAGPCLGHAPSGQHGGARLRAVQVAAACRLQPLARLRAGAQAALALAVLAHQPGVSARIVPALASAGCVSVPTSCACRDPLPGASGPSPASVLRRDLPLRLASCRTACAQQGTCQPGPL